MPKKGRIIDRTGEIWQTNEGYPVEIIACRSNRDCDIKFIYNGVVIYNLEYSAIKRGRVKNPYHPSIYGIGYYGIGKHKSWVNSIKRNTVMYSTWKKIMERCYCPDYQDRNPHYKGCSVSEIWHNFQNFGDWYEKYYKRGFFIDKDILVEGNRKYSPENCRFVPRIINNLFKNHVKTENAGCYKKGDKYNVVIGKNKKSKYLATVDTKEKAITLKNTNKEEYIREVAEFWKDEIDIDVYNKMINFKFKNNEKL